MSKILRLYNSYLRCIKEAKLSDGRLIEVPPGNIQAPKAASLYICGPTVYSDSHLGHALTYVRADIFRRAMKSLFGVRLTTVMNITDIDDKILARAAQEIPPDEPTPSVAPDEHPFRLISEKYYKSFTDDMNYVRVQPPDIIVKISKQIHLITNYIRRLEKTGHAYQASNGDIYFKVSSLPNYQGRVDCRSQADTIKQDIRDFVLWKACKPGEPVWLYKSDVNGKTIAGRPGWHVQCSAICSAIFGKQLDFHYGGKDLIFPHHYNEQACCCAYHSLDTSQNFHAWSSNWLHSGHLVLKDDKMSKSLGNVVGIRTFIKDTSTNTMRLLCVHHHYRTDVNFNTELMDSMRSLEHKVNAFCSYINEQLTRYSEAPLESSDNIQIASIEQDILQTREDILDGVCEDLDFRKGLDSILDLSKRVYNLGAANLAPQDVASLWHLLIDWSYMCGLDYTSMRADHCNQALFDLVKSFRQNTRDLVIDELRKRKKSASEEETVFLKSLLYNCDSVRTRLDELGCVIRDGKTKVD